LSAVVDWLLAAALALAALVFFVGVDVRMGGVTVRSHSAVRVLAGAGALFLVRQRFGAFKGADDLRTWDSGRFYDLPFIGMAVTSPYSKRWLQVNQTLCDILGYRAEELVEKTWSELTHPDDLAANLSLLREAIEGRRHAYSMEKRYLRKNGDMVWGAITVSVNRPPDGSPAYLITVIEDIHARKQAELALQRHQEELESRVQQRTRELQHSNAELALEVQQRLHAARLRRLMPVRLVEHLEGVQLRGREGGFRVALQPLPEAGHGRERDEGIEVRQVAGQFVPHPL